MEKLKALLGLLSLPFLAVLLPILGTEQDIEILLGSFAGVAGLVVIITQALKKDLNYKPGITWKYLPQTLCAGVSVLLSVVSWWLGIGLFAEFDTVLHAAILGLLISGIANGWYDVPFVQKWVKVLFGMLPKTKRQL